jgi:hypothetical protein
MESNPTEADTGSAKLQGLKGVSARNGKYSVNGILQSIFRSASRRETFGKHSKGGRRDGGLKMDWTKPPPTAWPMCIECRLDLG